MQEIEEGTVAQLGGNVITIAGMVPKTSGTIYEGLLLHLPGDASHGLFWDTSTSTWRAFGDVAAWPEATHRGVSFWSFAIPTAAFVLGATIKVAFLTDNVLVPASASVVGGGYESGLCVTQRSNTMVEEVHAFEGLKDGSPMQVSNTSRSASGVSQTISESVGVVTVTRE
jgi:hypothetical protein